MSKTMIGRIFNGRYKVIDCIGVGGMAEVYRAHDLTLSRIVALKVMLPQFAANPNFTQRFRQEAAAAANLQNPYIVNVYDWGKDEDTYFIVMEYVRGSDLKTAIKERGAINQRKVAEIGSQVCQALSVAHRLDIIHRDIKPQNIMIQPDGNVKVMDFGIAHAKNSIITQTSSVLGTAHYVSPEQAQGKPLTGASDIYSLGILLYEAATGKLPFDGTDAVAVAMQQVNKAPVPPSQINPEIDPSFEAIILRALEKDPARRFATTAEMKRALDDFLSGRPYSPYASSINEAETHILGGQAVQYGPAGATEIMPPLTPEMTGKMGAEYISPTEVPKKRKPWGFIAGFLVLVAIVASVLYLNNMFSTIEKITAPDVVGLDQSKAEQVIRNAGFTVGTISKVKSDEVEAGKVVSQDPEAQTKLSKGTKINLTISDGENQVVVPDLSGLTAEEANEALERAGLIGQAGSSEHSNDVDVNLVIRQDTPAGSRLAKGSSVTYYLSLGAENLSVPDVSERSESDAMRILQEAGFKVVIDREYSSSVREGRVVSYNPTGKATKGDTITITISKGAKPEPKPEPSSGSSSGGNTSGGTTSGGTSGSGSSGSGSGGTGSGGTTGSGSGSGGTGSGGSGGGN